MFSQETGSSNVVVKLPVNEGRGDDSDKTNK